MSETMFGRIERGRLSGVTVAQLALACSAVGLKFVARPYLDSEPVRDAAHARLLRRLHDQLPPSVGWRTEVPLPIPGDLRAWDAQCRLAGVIVAVEAEMRLDDLQALEHKVAVKRRDGAVDLVILLVAVTEGNRHRLADHRQELRGSFPLDARAVLSALRAGRPPAASGIVVL